MAHTLVDGGALFSLRIFRDLVNAHIAPKTVSYGWTCLIFHGAGLSCRKLNQGYSAPQFLDDQKAQIIAKMRREHRVEPHNIVNIDET
eukprot:1375579-Amphidinium_carterae.1